MDAPPLRIMYFAGSIRMDRFHYCQTAGVPDWLPIQGLHVGCGLRRAASATVTDYQKIAAELA